MIPVDEPAMNTVPDWIGRGAYQHTDKDSEEAQPNLPEIEAIIPAENQGECPEEEVYDT